MLCCSLVDLLAYQALGFDGAEQPPLAIPVPSFFSTDVTNPLHWGRQVPLSPQVAAWSLDPDPRGSPLGPFIPIRSDTDLSLYTDDSQSTGLSSSSSSQVSVLSLSSPASSGTMDSLSSSSEYECLPQGPCFVVPTLELDRARSMSTPLPQLGNHSAHYHHTPSNFRSGSLPYRQRDNLSALSILVEQQQQQQQQTYADIGPLTWMPMTQEPADMLSLSGSDSLYLPPFYTSPPMPPPAVLAPTIAADAMTQQPWAPQEPGTANAATCTSPGHNSASLAACIPAPKPRTRRQQQRDEARKRHQTELMRKRGVTVCLPLLGVTSNKTREYDRVRKQKGKANGREVDAVVAAAGIV